MSGVPSVDEVAHPRSGGARDDTFVIGLRCRACGQEHPQVASHLCELCFGPLEVVYDYEAVRAVISRKRIEAGPPTLWRYSDLLPVGGGDVVSLGEGFTPLIHARNLGGQLGLHNLHLKDDTQNPTNSFKDRVVSVAINWALRNGFTTIACASTGNLANAVAAYAARAGVRAVVFIPADLESQKIATTAVFGATIVPQSLWVLGVTIAIVGALSWFFGRTRLGKAMLATSYNRLAAQLVGIDVRKVLFASFGLAAALGAVAGVLIAPIAFTSYDVGVMLGLKGFAAAILGGLGSFPGAIVGGLVLGLLESLGAGYVSSAYKDVIAFVIILVVLFFRPSGILGVLESERV